MKNRRVVVTGLGVVAPNGIGVPDFLSALQNGESGIRYFQQLKDLGFSCCIGGQPDLSQDIIDQNFTKTEQRGLSASGIHYGVIAGLEAYKNAGLHLNENRDPELGICFGTGILGVDKFREAIHKIDAGNVRRLGSTSVIQTMASGISAFLNQKLKAGNQVTTNSSACITGTEAFIQGYRHIKNGEAEKMLVGSCSDHGPYVWGGFDAMRILEYRYNSQPELAAAPFSDRAKGFVPSSGSGALLLESMESAKKRNATILAEVIGSSINSGGMTDDGSMTAANSEAVIECIQKAIYDANIPASKINLVNGHFTGTKGDVKEAANWKQALEIQADKMPYFNSTKGMIGHALAASGSIELVASVLQMQHDFIHGNLNAYPLHEELASFIQADKICEKRIKYNINYIAKASFGFGDVNACVVLKKNNQQP